MQLLFEADQTIARLDSGAMQAARARLDSIAKPLHGLGKLEDCLVQIAGIAGTPDIALERKAAVVFCADNGVVARGVSQSGSEVTAIVARNMLRGNTCLCNLSRVARSDVVTVDIGMASDVQEPGILRRKIAYGTRDFCEAPAMRREEAQAAVQQGIALAGELKAQGYHMLAAGEMGIGNTTTASAMIAALLQLPPQEVTGRGAGLSDEGLARKLQVICAGLALHAPDPQSGLDVLHKVGGLDIAGMAGLCIGGALQHIPVVLDGVVSLAAALCACRIAPGLQNYLLASHMPKEPGGRFVLQALGLDPLLHADLCVGEGTGAVAVFPLFDMALQVYRNMVNFEDEGIAPYVDYAKK